MKKILAICLLIVIGFATSANAVVYKAKSFAIKEAIIDLYGINRGWGEWSDWFKTDINIFIDTHNKEVVIYSDEKQWFKITAVGDNYKDNNGGSQFAMSCYDKNNQKCLIRIRVDPDGDLQLYVEYNNLMYVYGSMVKISKK